MRQVILILLTLLSTSCNSQTLSSNRDKIEAAKNELKAAMTTFSSCIVNSDADKCILGLMGSANNEYKKYIVGGLLYEIDKEKSFQLHKEASAANPNDLDFNLEYAIELHRRGELVEAAKLYEKYLKAKPDDFRINVWLADCYINTGEIDKSIANWKKANHPENHTSIDQAIYTIYGKTDQIKIRNEYRKEIEKGNNQVFYSLVFLDMNWELDWWNSNVQEYFLHEDMRLAESKFKQNDNDYKTLQAYIKIKNLSKTGNQNDSIKSILTADKIIIGSNPLQPMDKSHLIYSEFASLIKLSLKLIFINNMVTNYSSWQKRQRTKKH